MSRKSPQPHSNRWDTAAVATFGLFAVVSILTMGDYGMSWDEWFRWRGGQEKLLYYLALFGDGNLVSATPFAKADPYPGLFDLSVAIINELTGSPLFQTGHSLSLAFGFLAVLAVWMTARRIGGPRAGFIALLLLILTPRFYGHQFFNPKDIPFAATYAWSLFALLAFMEGFPRPNWKQVVALGTAIGLTLATRIGGLVVFAYLAVACVWALARTAALSEQGTRLYQTADAGIKLFIRCFLVGIIALGVLLPWWPYAHSDPFGRLLETFMTVSEYPWNGPVLYRGQVSAATDLPWHYLPTWLGITAPPILLAALATGILVAIGQIRFLSSRWRDTPTAQVGIILLFAIFPILFVIWKDSTLYDGMRHLLFVLPPLAALGGLALDQFFRNTSLIPRVTVGSGLVLLALCSLWPMVRLHPYQYTYFNPFVGGLAGAEGLYETEYWGTSLREAVEILEDHTAMNGIDENGLKVWSSQPAIASHYFFPSGWIPVGDPRQADFFIALSRGRNLERLPGIRVGTVARDGTVFAGVSASTHSTLPPGTGESLGNEP